MLTDPRPPRFNPWPFAVIATLVVFMAGTAALVTIAVSHRSELVTPDYYEQDLAYETRLERQRRAEPWAERIVVAYNSATRQVLLSLPSPHAVAGASGTVSFYRPSEAGRDYVVPLDLHPDGTQRLPGKDLMDGLWKVRLEWQVGGDEYYADRTLVVTPREQP